MFWKKTGLLCIVLTALSIVAYAQTTARQHANSANMQIAAGPVYLGVYTLEVNADEAKARKLKEVVGLEVTGVTEGSPAARAGIHVQDVILELGDQKVGDGRQFGEAIGAKAPGTKVVLTISREGAIRKITATLESRSAGMMFPGIQQGTIYQAIPLSPRDMEAMIAAAMPPIVGYDGVAVTPQLAEYFGISQGVGVLVFTVYPKSPGERAGLKAGDIVTKVNGVPVANPHEISEILRQKKSVIFSVIRNKKEIVLSVEIARADIPGVDRGADN